METDKCLVGSRVNIRWPNFHTSFYGIVISQPQVNNSGKETSSPSPASSRKNSRYFSGMILQCEIKSLSPQTEAFCTFIVSSYNSSLKEHLVTFASGATEMLTLTRGKKQAASQNMQNQELESNKKLGQHNGNYPSLACKRIIPDPSCDTGPTQNDVADQSTHASKMHKKAREGSTEQEQAAAKSDQVYKRRILTPPSATPNDVADQQMHVPRMSRVQPLDPVLPVTSSPVRTGSSESRDKEQTPKNSTTPPNPVTSVGERSNETVDVSGYEVKATSAPILDAIFTKYGDVANDCIFKSKSVRASLLEVVCDVVWNLQNYYSDTILLNLETIHKEVADVEEAKIDVSWLHQHLSKLNQVSVYHNENLLLKKSKKNVGLVITEASEILKQGRLDLLRAQKHVKQTTKYVEVMNLVGRKIDGDILASENDEYFWRRRLGGLLEPEERFDM